MQVQRVCGDVWGLGPAQQPARTHVRAHTDTLHTPPHTHTHTHTHTLTHTRTQIHTLTHIHAHTHAHTHTLTHTHARTPVCPHVTRCAFAQKAQRLCACAHALLLQGHGRAALWGTASSQACVHRSTTSTAWPVGKAWWTPPSRPRAPATCRGARARAHRWKGWLAVV